jgi:hypothetical protein
MAKKHAAKKQNVQELEKLLQTAVEQGSRLIASNEDYKTTAAQLIEHNTEYALRIKEQAQEIELLRGKLGMPVRRHLPDTRKAVTHKFSVGGHEGYMTVGLFEDGEPGELFITMAKEGSTVGGLMDTIGRLTSVALQYGVSVADLGPKFFNQRFEPSGYTSNPEINQASSIIDYVFRWLDIQFVKSKTPPVTAPAV